MLGWLGKSAASVSKAAPAPSSTSSSVPSASTSNNNTVKRPADKDAEYLEDSDDDTQAQSKATDAARKRLKSAKQVQSDSAGNNAIPENTTKVHSVSNEADVKNKDDDKEKGNICDILEISFPSQSNAGKAAGGSSGKSTSSAASRATVGSSGRTIIDLDAEVVSHALPLLSPSRTGKSAGAAASTARAIEVSGGAAAFFGEPSRPVAPKAVSSKVTVASPSPTKRARSNSGEGGSAKKPTAKQQHVDEQIAAGYPLTGKKFVITGEFETSGRGKDGITDLIKSNGGAVMTAVSGATSFLVVGEYLQNVGSGSYGDSKAQPTASAADRRPVEEGSKYKTAVEKGVAILTEQQLLSMLPAAAAQPQQQKEKPWTVPHRSSSSSSAVAPLQTTKPALMRPSSSSAATGSSRIGGATDAGELLWVDKHKPTCSEHMIGSAEVTRKFAQWLDTWERLHLPSAWPGGVKPKFGPPGKENIQAKAALLSGPPGIGKTTLATLMSKEKGYSVLELNASDTRSKNAVSDELAAVVLSKAISSDGHTQKRLVIMDEVDGMGGSDRGGIPELIKVIKASMVPIVCICNDRQAQKIKSLANHCYDLRVKRPMKNTIATRLVEIGRLEGLQIEQSAAELMVEQCGNDIRQAIHAMQMWRASSKSVTYAGLKDGLERIEKDKVLRQSPFDSCLTILQGMASTSNFDHRYNSFFVDYSLVPLLVQQNYIESARSGVCKNPRFNDVQKLEAVSRAADAAADMEIVGSKLMGGDQHWELLPAQAVMAVRVGALCNGWQAFPTFPQWLGKQSTTGKMRRLTSEIVMHSALSCGQGFLPMRMEYIPYLRSRLLSELMAGASGSGAAKGKAAADDDDEAEGAGGSAPAAASKCIELLDAYGLSRDDFMENMKSLQFVSPEPRPGPLDLKDKYEALESKSKAAFTRLYNAKAHTSQALVAEQAISTGKKRKGGGRADDEEEGFEGQTTEDLAAAKAIEEDEDDDAVDLKAFAAAKKKPAAKAKGPAAKSKK